MSRPSWIAQMRKGVAEFAVLRVIAREDIHGHGIFEHLSTYTMLDLPEGTLYPMLSRLKRQGLVRARKVPSVGAPPKQLYSLTPQGQLRLEAMRHHWAALVAEVTELDAE